MILYTGLEDIICFWTWLRPERWWSTSEGKGRLHNPCVFWERMLAWRWSTSTWASTSTTDWKTNIKAVCKKGMSRLYFLRKLKSFNVCSKMLEILYQSVVASALNLTVVCWGSSIGADDNNRLNKLIKKAISVIGCKPDTFEVVVERRTLNKLLSIMDNPDHPLHHLLDRQWSTFKQTGSASLSQGPIQEIFPAQSNNSLQHFTSV